MRRSSLSAVVLSACLAALPATAWALTVDLELESVAVDSRAGELVASGTVTCDEGATLRIGFAVTQGPATAGGFEIFTCTGTEQAWELREPLGTPRVHPGPAILEFGFLAMLGEEGIASGRSVEAFIAPANALHLFWEQPPG